MKLEFQSFTVPPASIFSFDIIWVLVLTPIVGQVVYPLLKYRGISCTSLRRIGVGMLFAAASMIVAGLVEIIRRREVEEGHFFDQVVFGKHRQASNLNIFWQVPQFLIMGCAEVLAVTTGRHALLFIIIIITIIMVCNEVEVRPVLQEVTRETLNYGANKAPVMTVWIFMLKVYGRDRDLQSSTFGCVTLMQTLTET